MGKKSRRVRMGNPKIVQEQPVNYHRIEQQKKIKNKKYGSEKYG